VAVDRDPAQDKAQTWWNRPGWLGVPVWAWAVGWLIGLAISILMFDNIIVAVLFAFSIGTVFALAFRPGEWKNRKK
jgi:hypothetical protein